MSKFTKATFLLSLLIFVAPSFSQFGGGGRGGLGTVGNQMPAPGTGGPGPGMPMPMPMPGPAPAPGPGPAPNYSLTKPSSQESNGKLVVQNKCGERFRFAVSFLDSSNNWRIGGWWDFEPNEKATLSSGGKSVASSNSIFYYFAESGSYKWQGEQTEIVNNEKVRMKKVELNRNDAGNWQLNLSCN